MPPQPGIFAVPYASAHKSRAGVGAEVIDAAQPVAGPSRGHGAAGEEAKREKKRKEMAGRLGKEISERRDDAARHYAETISDLHGTFIQLTTHPETLPAFSLRLYPLTLERSARLASLDLEEQRARENVKTAYEEECELVEKEWRTGRDRIRERMLEGIEERRRKAREEKDGDGTVGEGILDAQSRSHNTRKLRNKLGTSPPPTPLSGAASGASGLAANGNLMNGPLLDPLSLSVDELPSAFALSLTAGRAHASAANGAGAAAGGATRRRTKNKKEDPASIHKNIEPLEAPNHAETEADLGEIRRGNKRRRVAVGAMAVRG